MVGQQVDGCAEAIARDATHRGDAEVQELTAEVRAGDTGEDCGRDVGWRRATIDGAEPGRDPLVSRCGAVGAERGAGVGER